MRCQGDSIVGTRFIASAPKDSSNVVKVLNDIKDLNDLIPSNN